MPLRAGRGLALAILFSAFAVFGASTAQATKIERVVSPGGIEAWLVREPSVPLIAMEFAFRGGANEEPADKAGIANMASALLDEGAGDLDSRAFQKRLDDNAVEMSFRATRDDFRGTLRVLTERKEQGFDLLRLALNAPRFDAEAVERIRAQIVTGLKRESTNPNEIASRLWWSTAFPNHPYGHPVRGTLESVAAINAADLHAFAKRVFARDRLKVAVVGDIDGATLGGILDRVFGALPASSPRFAVPPAKIEALGRQVFVDLDVPQTVLTFGGVGIPRKDPDFFAGYLLNHILGGGSFTSRLYQEVREKRGLAYSVYSYMLPLDGAALLMGGTATRADRAEETVSIILAEIKRLAAEGPTADELAKAKAYQQNSYALNFDTSAKIAGQLVQIQLDDLGIDYIDRRSALIEAVTLDDVRRAAGRVLQGGVLFAVVGRPAATLTKKEGG
jgi:zinc protease